MDILAHSMWSMAAARTYNRAAPPARKTSLAWSAWWGVFPDFLAFVPFWLWFLFEAASGGNPRLPSPEELEPLSGASGIAGLTNGLYAAGHSVIVWAAAFALIWGIRALRRRPSQSAAPLPLGGWLLHILIDIPSHTYRFFPTPALWPVSGWRFDGISWGNPWFMLVNYSLLLVVYGYFHFTRRRDAAE